MKKLSKFVVAILFSLLFIPHVNAGVPSITVPGNMVYVYYDYDESTGSSVSYNYNTTYFNNGNIYVIKDGALSNDTRNFIFVKKRKLTRTFDLPAGDWANITLRHAAYYNDDSGNRIYLDINVKLTELKLVPKNGDSCNSSHRYAVFSFAKEVKKVYTSARVVSGSELKEVSENNCSANVRAAYDITFTRSDTGALAPSNMVFLWKISDIDQPDKKYDTYDYSKPKVDFVESMNFSSGFDTKFYRANPTYLRRKKDDNGNFTNKFIAQRKSDSEAADPGNTKTSVWVFQKGPVASAVWRGSWGVETGLVGNNTGYAPPICKIVDDKHYGINGNEVNETTFNSQCICKAINDKYYGISGTEVNDETTFKSQCSCRFIGNGQYLDVNGNVTNFDGWKTSCTCNKRGDYYYGSNGQVVTFWNYKSQCFEYEYTGDSCSPSKNEVVDNSCNGASILDNPKKRVTKFEELNLNSESLEHTSCKSGVYGVNTSSLLYIKEPTQHMDIVYNNEKITNGCAPVSVSIPFTIVENIYLNISKLNGKKIKGGDSDKEYVYAGGGFGWGGSTVKNDLTRIWAVFKKNPQKNGDTFEKAFKLSFNYKLGISTPSVGYYKLSEVPLYKDNNCTETISYDELENTVVANNKIEINDLSLDQKFYASTDVNDVEVTEKSMLGVLNKEPNPEIGGFSNKTNSVSLKTAYIDRRTAKVSYSDTISIDEANINSENNNFINAGQLYYVPLKYTGDEFAIGMSNQNLSVIGQATSFTTICKINVEHIFYEDNGFGRLRTAFHYRPIKTNDTFNGQSKEKIAVHAQNWAQWYCDENGNCGDTTNRRRIENTYEVAGCGSVDTNNEDGNNNRGSCTNPLYQVNLNSENIPNILKYNESVYSDFGNINNDGSSDFVSTIFGHGGSANSLSYCNLGQFKASCYGRNGS